MFRVYFCFLSSHHAERPEDLKPDEWNAAFMRRLPATPVGKKHDLATGKGVTDSFRELVGELAQAGGGDVDSMVANAAKALDYAAWYEEVREKLPYESNPKSLKPVVIEFVRRFAPPPSRDSEPRPRTQSKGFCREPPQGFEPWTPALRKLCSTAELRRRGRKGPKTPLRSANVMIVNRDRGFNGHTNSARVSRTGPAPAARRWRAG